MTVQSVICALAALATPLAAQERPVGLIGLDGKEMGAPAPTPVRAADVNTSKLQMVISLDREEYLSGEMIAVKISITNPTGSALEVYEPLKIGSGFMNAEQKIKVGEESRWSTMYPDLSSYTSYRPATLRTRIIQAGERLELHARSTDIGVHDQNFPLIPELVLAGEYRVRYNYAPSDPVEFRVVPAKMELLANVPGGQPIRYQERELPTESLLAVMTGEDGLRRIVISSEDRMARGRDPKDPRTPGQLLPFVRIADIDQPIVTLSGQRNASGEIAVTWTTSSNQTKTIQLNADRTPKQ